MKIKTIQLGEIGSSDLNGTIIQCGPEKKPSILFICGIHGNETHPLFIINDLLKRENEFPSQVDILVNANPLAMVWKNRFNPLDMRDLNRVFPGSKIGESSEKIAQVIMDLARKYELVVELHTFEEMEMGILGIIPNKGGSLNQPAMNFLNQFKVDHIWRPNLEKVTEHQYRGALGTSLAFEDIPTCVIEFPSVRISSQEKTKEYAAKLLRTLQTWTVEPAQKAPVVERKSVRSNHTGIFIPQGIVGRIIKKGERVGSVISLGNFQENAIMAEYEGIYLQQRQRGYVNQGDELYSIGLQRT